MPFTLEEKQQYYRYPSSNWKRKDMPALNPEVADAMKHEGFEDKYRFVWLGVDVVRKSDVDTNPVVYGPREGCRVRKVRIGFRQVGRMQVPVYADWIDAKKVFVHTRQLAGIFYVDDDGHRVNVSQPQFAPPGRIVQFEWSFHTLGYLEWRMEEHVTLEQARAAASDDGWVSIGTIRAKNGGYAEPSLLHVADFRKRASEDRNRSKNEIIALAKAEGAQRDEDKEWEKTIAAAADEAEVKHYVSTDFLPYVERQPHTVS